MFGSLEREGLGFFQVVSYNTYVFVLWFFLGNDLFLDVSKVMCFNDARGRKEALLCFAVDCVIDSPMFV